jgi:hypothetical protein
MSDEGPEDSTDWGTLADVVPPLPASTLVPETTIVRAAPASQWESFSAEDFDDTYKEPFDRADAQKFGIIGGKGVGKSYLFQAMVYRVLAGEQSGALNQYLEKDSVSLFVAEQSGEAETGAARLLNRLKFVEQYKTWTRLPQTTRLIQQWYRLRLPIRTGWLGGTRAAMDVEFFDGSGEGLFEARRLGAVEWKIWERAYGQANVMIFCLPLWAAFPNGDLTEEDWDFRDRLLDGFEQTLTNYRELRRRAGERPVSSILALTMSDDDRSALQTLRSRWIIPYREAAPNYLKRLKKGAELGKYLNNARKVSEALLDEFASSQNPNVSDIPNSLNFGRGKPWVVALSAINGSRLDYLDNKYRLSFDDPGRKREAREIAPVPIHVELPLLVALCERENALM